MTVFTNALLLMRFATAINSNVYTYLILYEVKCCKIVLQNAEPYSENDAFVDHLTSTLKATLGPKNYWKQLQFKVSVDPSIFVEICFSKINKQTCFHSLWKAAVSIGCLTNFQSWIFEALFILALQ